MWRSSVSSSAACAELAGKVGGKVMPLYRGTNERGALALGVAGWDSLDGVEALLELGPAADGRRARERPLPRRLGPPAAARVQGRRGRPARHELRRAAGQLHQPRGHASSSCGRRSTVEPPLKESWEVLCELGAALGLDLDYAGIFPIQREAASKVPALAALAQPPSPGAGARAACWSGPPTREPDSTTTRSATGSSSRSRSRSCSSSC